MKPAGTPCSPPARRSNAGFHDGGMAVAKSLQDGVVIELERVTGQFFGGRGRQVRAVMHRRLFPFLLQHGLGILHPSVMKDSATRIRQPFFRTALEILL